MNKTAKIVLSITTAFLLATPSLYAFGSKSAQKAKQVSAEQKKAHDDAYYKAYYEDYYKSKSPKVKVVTTTRTRNAPVTQDHLDKEGDDGVFSGSQKTESSFTLPVK